MKRIAAAATLAVSLAGAGAACPYPVGYDTDSLHLRTAEVLWDACGRTTDGAPPPPCLALVEGLSDGLTWGASVAGTSAPFCFPDGFTDDQKTDVVRRFLSDNPELRKSSAALVAENAFTSAFPCTTPPPPPYPKRY